MKLVIAYTPDGRITSSYTGVDQMEPAPIDGESYLFLYGENFDNINVRYLHETHYVKNGLLKTYTPAQILARDNTPPGYTWVPKDCNYQDLRLLEEAKTQRWEAIKKIRSQKESGTFFHNNVEYDVDQIHIPGATQLALLSKASGEPFSINWTTASNSVVTLNADQMVALGTALASYVSGLYDTARVLRDQINAAVTNADVDSINWP